jgi:molecular chaperone DnaK
VSATDKASNKTQTITITSSSGLSKEEIEKMKTDADAHADEDKKKRDLSETRNIADTTIYTVEKMMTDFKDKMSDDEKKDLQTKIDAVKAVKDGEDLEAMKNTAEELSKAAQTIGAKMYQENPQAAPGAEGTSATEEKATEPKDAEFTEKTEEKKDDTGTESK